ncbi:DHH family phosphoesterase [Patescibacteria group bacterium]|nr:DHH family phosphoesterase [Patescibacteria group bacterium]
MTELPAGQKIVLTDHNEAGQSISNRSDYKIIGIVDHHKIGDLETNEAIAMRVEPVGCACTVIYAMFKENGYVPNAMTAHLMISAIISDTLYYRSPTTTNADRQAIEELNAIAKIDDLEAYSMEMFSAKSDLGDISVRDLIMLDYKTFEAGSKKLGIGAVETTNAAFALSKKDAILTELNEIKAEQEIDFIMLSVIDILNEKNTTIISNHHDASIVKEVFGAETTDGIADLGNRLSRKKQLAAPLSEYFTSRS